MCGIVGWTNSKLDLREGIGTLNKMLAKLTNRGPNEGGIYTNEEVGLGHRRLIVIDPDGGKQPMTASYKNKKATIIYNGELYNTEAIRQVLRELGHRFNSYSDTEVLLRSYLEWGKDCVEYLNGIFAFAIWESQSRELFLVRDRLGVKPLFYSRREDEFIFGSEIKALLAHPHIEPRMNKEGLMELLGIGPGRSLGRTPFKGIEEVLPGQWITFKDGEMKTHMYWELEAKEHLDNLEETGVKVKELVKTAVERQLISDVPLCTFLSGGLDSSIISSIGAKVYKDRGQKLKTYSLNYVGNEKYFKKSSFQGDLDTKWVDLMVQHIGSRHEKVIIGIEELLEALQDSVDAMDLPGMADIDSSLNLFCKRVSKESTVALSGECADEIFGGYPWFRDGEPLDTFPWSRFVGARKELLHSRFASLPMEEYVKEQFKEVLDHCKVSDREVTARHQKMMQLNIKGFMLTLLNRKDRMSMHNSLEVRVPFADHHLVEYAYNIPPEMKDHGGYEKGILRKAFSGELPEEIAWRRKNPYPKTHHPLYAELIKNRMLDVLNHQEAPIHNFIKKETLETLVKTKGEAYTKPWYGQLMTGPQLIAYFYQLNDWLDRYHIIYEDL